MYSRELVQPMKAVLLANGFEELTTSEEVKNVLSAKEGTVFLVINSVCGCSAGTARPGALEALQNKKQPEKLYTVFAGFDIEAVAEAREFLTPYPPSSPSMALFKNGKLVHFVERTNIEGFSAQDISENLIAAFDKYC